MSRARNLLLPLAGFVTCVAAFASYPLFFVRFPMTRDVPWANWLLFALGLAGVIVGLVRAFRHPERFRGKITTPILAALSLAVCGFFLFMTEVASRRLPAATAAPRIGDKAPDFTLPDVRGEPVRLSEILASRAGSWALLIFYRGYW
jgi:AhpC/TSA family